MLARRTSCSEGFEIAVCEKRQKEDGKWEKLITLPRFYPVGRDQADMDMITNIYPNEAELAPDLILWAW